MEDVNKITIKYATGETKEVEQGFVMYIMPNGNDAQAEFIGINDRHTVKAMLNAMVHALNTVDEQWKHVGNEQ